MLNRKGTVFATSLIVAMLMILICVSTYTMVLQDAYMVKRMKFSTQALMLAEAGINDALGVLLEEGFAAKDDALYFPLTEDLGNDRSYTVTVSDIGERTLLSSTGTAGGVSRVVEVEVKGGASAPAALSNMMTSASGININLSESNSSVVINGDMHSNDGMSLAGSGTLAVAACGEGDCDGTVSISNIAGGGPIYIDPNLSFSASNVVNDAPVVTLPNFDYNYYKNLADWIPGEQAGVDDGDDYYSEGLYIENWSTPITLSPKNGIIYVEGNAVISAYQCHLNGGIVATNNVDIFGDFYQHKTGNCNVIIGANGNVSLYGEPQITVEEALVYSGGNLRLGSTLLPTGAFITGTLCAQGTISIADGGCPWAPVWYTAIFNHKIMSPDGLINTGSSGEIEIVSWNR